MPILPTAFWRCCSLNLQPEIPMSHSIAEAEAESWIGIVRQKVEAMRFGSVQIIVHEGRVTQVESTEKTRLPDAVAPVLARKK